MDYDAITRRWGQYLFDGQPNPVVIHHDGVDVMLHLPPDDYISQMIVGTNTFYEIDVLEHIRRNHKRQKTIVDVGANIGNHARFFETFLEYEKMVCFEPDLVNFTLLRQNIVRGETIAVHSAVGLNDGKVSVSKLFGNNCGSYRVVPGDDCMMIPLDHCYFTDVTLLKIDVEGAELDVLKGGTRTIIEQKPLIYIELTERETECRALLASFGYMQTNVFEFDGVASHEFTHSTKIFALLA